MKNIRNRFLLALALCMTMGLSSLTAQTLPWDSTMRPQNFKAKLLEFQANPIVKGDYVFMGNSITAAGNWSKLLDLPQAKNRGISGDITFGLLERLDEVIAGKPAKLFVLVGINDISRDIPDSVILANYKKLINMVRKGSSKTQIYFYTLLPVNASFEKFKRHYGKDGHILWLNNEIKKLSTKKVTVIDLYPHFTDKDKRLKAELTKDGLHLIHDGYKVWAEVLKRGNYLK
jgi:lysophospholipase L1-like esterase